MNYGCRNCRREGEKLFLKGDRCLSPKCAVVKKPYAPGAHGAKGQYRLTDYAKQLKEKQRARRYYQLSEKQFFNYYLESSKRIGNTSEILWQKLEMRLDNIIRRAGICRSLTEARQLVSHGKITINGKKVDIPSYEVKVKDKIIAISSDLKPVSKQDMAKWLSYDAKSKTTTVGERPVAEATEMPFNISLVIEFYSK